MRAVEKYDYRRVLRFQTYAMWWIKAFMHRALSEHSRVIRLPVYIVELRSKPRRAADELAQQHGRVPSPAEVAAHTGVPLSKVVAALGAPEPPLSLEARLGAGTDARLADLMPDTRATSPAVEATSQDTRERIRQLLATLTPREQRVLRLHFGMDGNDESTLEQIGKEFSLSRERIRQIEAEALAKLRKQAEGTDLDYDLAG